MDSQTIARFWAKVDKNGPVPTHMPHLGQCWIWLAGRTCGYGSFRLLHRSVLAHRFSWLIAFGEHTFCVLHKCDNPRCVRPDHLFLGTRSDNATDRDMKGRNKPGRGHPESLVRPEGGDHPWSKLDEEAVLKMRATYARGETQTALAREYGVTKHAVWRIIHRKNWKHI